ncbi:MAG: MoxR family ATPase [Vicinamibacterales bacterium]
MKTVPAPELAALEADVRAASGFVDALLAEVGRVVVGQTSLLNRLLTGLLTGGHVLLEGPPGVAKTLTVRTFAESLGCSFHRIQFTPDLLPADVVGTMIFHPRDGEFRVHHGPIFANVVLADEINRAPAKVQSALLEAMQERRVTIGRETHVLAEPFLVLATQNPLEHEGTYPLPEAQLDRFALQVLVPYPTPEDELQILARHLGETPAPPRPVATAEDVVRAREVVSRVFLDPRLQAYVVGLVRATREVWPGQSVSPIRFGASPRATVHVALAARAQAFLAHRAYVLPEDIKLVAPDALRHRLMLTYEAEAEGVSPSSLIDELLRRVPVP